MVVCNFFLQGRCRYGEKCWNEHPVGGSRGGGGYNQSYSRSGGQQQQSRGGGGGGGGFGNRVWVNPSQQRGGYIQPSSFSSQGSTDWGSGREGGGGRRENVKSSNFSFSTQNRFSALNTSNAFDKGRRGEGGGGSAADEDDDKKLEVIQVDIDAWESSGQWGFSCYSPFKAPISGFTDLSPEELRLEYYSTKASGDLQGYLNGVNQLLSQWKSRIQELKIMSPSTRQALLAELNGKAPQSSSIGFGSTTAPGFGFSTSGFGSKGLGASAPASTGTFGFPAPSSGFDASSTSSPSTGFGSLLSAPTQPPSGFGAPSAPSASSFSFAPSNAAFSPSTTAANSGGGFRSAFGADSSTFKAAAASPAAGEAADGLFSAEGKLTQEEVNQFKAKRFTLGQIPLKPPPANMLVV
ncbi:PREDICTED: nucleoporin-like protein 2 isoform X2 [Cyprinodon variegatus]|uniref:Nucleoporin NUP42 n=1 Tax=Cyprinodon variegatus TaxID=28743 RepID=A0A3Q2FR56_CYPVA|nr:PREDICTED: nucleoporin-like protein 2 isoform X2 [Cyprinodon variegatus]